MNLLPISTGKTPIQPRTLWWRTFQRADHQAVREGDWKFLKDGAAEYLFNLADDSDEQHDLKELESDLFQQLKREFAAVASEMLEPVPLFSIRSLMSVSLPDLTRTALIHPLLLIGYAPSQ